MPHTYVPIASTISTSANDPLILISLHFLLVMNSRYNSNSYFSVPSGRFLTTRVLRKFAVSFFRGSGLGGMVSEELRLPGKQV